jgi:hypothetical protein
MDQVRADLKGVSDARVSVEVVERMSASGGRQGELQASVQGPKTASLDELSTLTDRIVAGLKQTPGIVDVDSTYEGGKPQVSIAIDRSGPPTWGVSAAQPGFGRPVARRRRQGDAVGEGGAARRARAVAGERPQRSRVDRGSYAQEPGGRDRAAQQCRARGPRRRADRDRSLRPAAPDRHQCQPAG